MDVDHHRYGAGAHERHRGDVDEEPVRRQVDRFAQRDRDRVRVLQVDIAGELDEQWVDELSGIAHEMLSIPRVEGRERREAQLPL